MNEKIKQIVESKYLNADGVLNLDKFERIEPTNELKPYVKEIFIKTFQKTLSLRNKGFYIKVEPHKQEMRNREKLL